MREICGAGIRIGFALTSPAGAELRFNASSALILTHEVGEKLTHSLLKKPRLRMRTIYARMA